MLVLGFCYCGVSRQHNKNLLKETGKLNLWNNNTGCFRGISTSIWKKSLWAMPSELGTRSHKNIWVRFIILVLWGMALVFKFTLFVLNAVHGVKNPGGDFRNTQLSYSMKGIWLKPTCSYNDKFYEKEKLIYNWDCQKILPTWKEKYQNWKNTQKTSPEEYHTLFWGTQAWATGAVIVSGHMQKIFQRV